MSNRAWLELYADNKRYGETVGWYGIGQLSEVLSDVAEVLSGRGRGLLDVWEVLEYGAPDAITLMVYVVSDSTIEKPLIAQTKTWKLTPGAIQLIEAEA